MEAVIALVILGTIVYFVYKTLHSVIKIQRGAQVAQLWQEDKGFQFVTTVIAGALTIWVVWMLMKDGQGDTSLAAGPKPEAVTNQTENVDSSAPHVPSNARLAAVPASTKEWSEIQQFIRRTWAIATSVGNAQKNVQANTTAAANRLDLDGVRNAELRHLLQIDRARTALEQTHVPNVANPDGQAFAVKAYNSLHELILLEHRQTQAVIKSLNSPDETPTAQELASMTREINAKTGSTVISLHRLYWTYGYKDADFDESTFSLKKGAKPSTTVSFSRGHD